MESTIKAKLGKKMQKDFDQTQFDVLLLEGMDLIELTPEDKAFLEKFNQVKTLNLNYTGLRNLKNLPVIDSLE